MPENLPTPNRSLKKLEKDNKKLKTDVLEWCDIISMESKKMSRDTKINI